MSRAKVGAIKNFYDTAVSQRRRRTRIDPSMTGVVDEDNPA
jgi:hypothetical protein